MSRNEVSRFSLSPVVQAPRSRMHIPFNRLTSFDVGELACLCSPIEVLPGDTWKIKSSKVCRMQTLKTPMFGDIILDSYWFFVPSRLVWDHWREFMGENNDSAWIPEVTYSVPQITAPSGGWAVGSIADHLGIPPLVDNISVNAIPFRGLALIYDQWFRSEVVQDPLVIEKGDSTVVGSNGTNYITDIAKGGALPICNKLFDVYTGATVSPQKGEAVSLNLADPVQTLAPVYTSAYPNTHFLPETGTRAERYTAYKNAVNKSYPEFFEIYNAPKIENTPDITNPKIMQAFASIDSTDYGLTTLHGEPSTYYQTYLQAGTGVNKHGYEQVKINSGSVVWGDKSGIVPVNLVADVDRSLSMITINELRQAFQIQRFLERSAYSGSRYIETLRAHFGVVSPDARLQRSEYLGGNRITLNIRQITQTSQTTETSPLGDVAAMSVTTDTNFDFEKSFTEHGYIFGLCVARYRHTYQQGIPKTFLRKTMYDYFWPEFNSLGNFGIRNCELYAQGYDPTPDPVTGEVPPDVDNEIFGYQEAWYDYRNIPNSICSQLRSVSNSGLDTWHLADDYTELPTLSASWLREDKSNVDRVLSVTSAVSNQIFADIYCDAYATRRMTLYSIPGLIDHF